MKVSYNNFSIRGFSPINFTSTRRCTIDNGIKIQGNYTNMFRQDIDWEKLVDLILENNCHNIYSLACSDGSEAYSIAILLIERLGEKAEQFKPIYAGDSDEYIINVAKSGQINLRESDIERINNLTKNNFSKYFTDIGGDFDEEGYKPYKVNQNLKDFVVFEKCDATKLAKGSFPPNSLILLRNFWAFMPIEKQQEFAKDLHDSVQDNSFIVLGSFDLTRTNAVDYLEENGFKTSKKIITMQDIPPLIYDFIGANVFNEKIKNGVLYK